MCYLKLKSAILIMVVVLLASCKHNPAVVVLPLTDSVDHCDTTTVSYNKDVKPVLQNNCYGCHGTTAIDSGGGLNLEDFSSLKQYLQYGFRGDGVYGSKFYHCITHSQWAQAMPPGYMLDTCSLNKIKRWIDLGAANN